MRHIEFAAVAAIPHTELGGMHESSWAVAVSSEEYPVRSNVTESFQVDVILRRKCQRITLLANFMEC